jgi:acyl-CoA thioesterase II
MTETRATTPEDMVAELVTLLDVQQEAPDLFRGRRKPGGVGRVFGGQIIAQALMAATKTVEPDRLAHSLHAYFIRGGSEDHTTDFQVVRDFDGRSFSTRRVAAIQNGEIILNFAASFQKLEEGLMHQDEMPDVPPPEGLKSERELRQHFLHLVPESFRESFLRPNVVEFRPVQQMPIDPGTPQPALYQAWFRLVASIGDDPLMHRGAFAYISDMRLLGTCTMPHGLNWMKQEINSASLDHAVWMHDDFRVDDWLLFQSTSPISNRGRGLNHGQIFSRDGRLVASAAQEGLVRKRRQKPEAS